MFRSIPSKIFNIILLNNMTTKFLNFLAAALLVSAFGLVLATSEADIQYPIKSLNNCANKEACRKYCSDPRPDRVRECLQVAREHNLMSSEKIAAAEKALNLVGPGGCRGPACKTYCDESGHMQECLRFGIKNRELIGQFDEDFAEDVDEMEAVLEYIEGGGRMPAGCSSEETCMAACQDPENIEVCMEMGTAMGVATGKMTAEQAASPVFKQMMRLMMTKGGPLTEDGTPCRFDGCDDVDPEDWMLWMKENGLNPADMMSAADKEEMMQGMDQIDKMMTTASPELKQCVEKALGGTTEDIRAGRIVPSPDVRYEIEDCFGEYMDPSAMMGGGGPPGMMGGTGPGGCEGPEECMEYCSDPKNQEECGGSSVNPQDTMRKMMPQGIPAQCATSPDPAVITQCMMDYCMKSFMSGTPDPACMSAMQQGVSAAVGSGQYTAQSDNVFSDFVNWLLGR